METGRETPQEVVAAALRVHRGRLSALVRTRVPAGDVDDVLQIAAMRAIERAESLQDPSRVVPWLCRVHRNVAIDESRRRSTQQRWLAQDLEVPEHATSETASLCDCSVTQALRMRPSYAEVLNLVDVCGATVAEAAHALGISANNVAVRLHRARKALRQSMLEHCGVTSSRECADCRCVEDGCCAA